MAGGISAGIVGIPLALAFGAQSGLGPVAGFYGAIALSLFASVCGGTPTQISGPTGPMIVVAALVVSGAIEHAGSLELAYPTIIATFFFAGLMQALFGFLKFGKYIRYIPYPVVSGFMTGIGVIIILLQIFPLVGKESPKGIHNILRQLPEVFSDFNYEAAGLGLVTVAIIFLFPKITRTVPNILLALVAVSVLAVWTDFRVVNIGAIPSQLPEFKLSLLLSWENMDLKLIFYSGITLALLGSIDSLLTSVIADNVTKTKHDSNQELIGQGLGNMAAASIGGIPGAGTTMSTLVNTNSGARTRLSGVVHGLSLILVLVVAGPWVSRIPVPVLAGILVTVGIGIIDYKGLKHIKRLPREETLVMIAVLSMTIFADLIQAVALGMILSSILFMKKMGDLAETQTEVMSLGSYSNSQDSSPDETVCLTPELSEAVFIKRLRGPLFFGFAMTFQDIAKQFQGIHIVILKMKEVPFIDQTGLFAMEEVVLDLKSRGITVFICGLQDQPHDMLMKIDMIPSLIPENFLFPELADCVDYLSRRKTLKFSEDD
ncbi:SulP family inorganic anion transporter [Nitrospina gracilis]|uniref:SulP family inorganic anion transporter n=1 Tax=Nitrospina gracilis TaxID=35801 RepID=UPI001F3A620E|nr:SulP family inorganic anion transporter [Nitrospina gracilis]MCF8719883.1 SulP family sulfate permease [Nitrospina gracilis Nb-211]